jgi:Transposase DDE domain
LTIISFATGYVSLLPGEIGNVFGKVLSGKKAIKLRLKSTPYACPELVQNIQGLLLGDKGYMRPALQNELKTQGVHLQTPLRDNMNDSRPKEFLYWMKGTRRLIETVIGQLTERFHIEKVRARDLWHQASRFWRKLLAHTICVRISKEMGNKPLQFEHLVTS